MISRGTGEVKLRAGEKTREGDLCIWIQGGLSTHNLCKRKSTPVQAMACLFEQEESLISTEKKIEV